MFPWNELPSVESAIQDGIDRRLHTGVQIYVSLDSAVVVDSAIGEAAPGRAMTASTLMPWRSAGKPLTAFLVMQCIEMRRLDLSTRVAELLHEFSDSDKADVTVFDLLTHQSGFPQSETGWPLNDWDESIRRILNTPRQLETGTAAYHPQSSWFLLGEILRRLESNRSASGFSEILQTRLLHPLSMSNTTCAFKADSVISLAPLLPLVYERDKGQLVEHSYGRAPWITQPSPGASLRGPVRELGRFYEMLQRGGRSETGQQLVSTATIQQMTARHRTGKFDQTFQHTVDFGLGVLFNSNPYGVETVPYGFGQYCSEATYGHGGSQCSMGFCDPERQLVVAWSANGFCGEGQHQRRNRMINHAIYEDLGLT
ncbi:MAG: beta-lactamase family protein [Fuerstia sp.]|nr:beta-lactamase family protein [Fuerstiella sp.]